MSTYLVTGAGISAYCHDKASVLQWVDAILEKGGIPRIQAVLPSDGSHDEKETL